MSSENIKAKILDMIYDRDNNLFKLLLQDIDKNKQTNIGVKGTDWGVTPEVPDEVIKQFCKDMIGKEKTLYIEVDNSSLVNTEKDEKGIVSKEAVEKVSENLNNYPVDEIMNSLYQEEKEDEN